MVKELSQLLVYETSMLLKVVLDLCFQLLYHILMKYIFVSLQKHWGKAQQTCGGPTGHPDWMGRAAAVLQVKAEGDIFHELQLIVATVFSLGHWKVMKDHTAAGLIVAALHRTSSSLVSTHSGLLIHSSVKHHSTWGSTCRILVLCCDWGLTRSSDLCQQLVQGEADGFIHRDGSWLSYWSTKSKTLH